MQQTYICRTCGSTKKIIKPIHMPVHEFIQYLPPQLICGVRDCTDFARK